MTTLLNPHRFGAPAGMTGTVLIITGNPASPTDEAQLLAGLVTDLGMTPAYVDDNGFAGDPTAKLIIFENSASANNANAGAWLNPGAPVLMLDGYMSANGQFDFTAAANSNSSADGIQPLDPNHPLWDGITLDGNGNFPILTGGAWTYASSAANLNAAATVLGRRVVVATGALAGSSSQYEFVYLVPAGTTIPMGTTQAPFLVIGNHFNTYTVWHANKLQLIKNALTWLYGM